MTILGIDLGTTFSAVSIVRDGQPILLPVGNDRIMPSVVATSPDGRWLVGRPALNQWVLSPETTVRSIKRQMGTAYTVALNGKNYTPPQISAIILQALKTTADAQLEAPITQTVITVPAYFSEVQRQATHDAGQIAGLEVVRIINEPTAAALAYGLAQNIDQLALVYDLGGGTFDVSLVEFSAGIVDVRASHGNTHLGGDDFDERLARWLTAQFEAQHGIDLRGDTRAEARIRRAAEQAKIHLSTEPFTWVREEYLSEKRSVPLHLEVEVSRVQFVSLIDDLLQSTLESVAHVLHDSAVEQPDHVLLVGGSTYIPAVWELVANETGLTPRSDVNPSEAVALGAGIQGAIISGEMIDAILVDVTPHSIGIAIAEMRLSGEIVDDRFKPLIHRNSTIPAIQQEIFTTLSPSQRSAQVQVYQGESPIASQNTLLGEFMFENMKPETPNTPPRVIVEFDLDVNGILNVKVVDRGSGNESRITVKASQERMSQAAIRSARLELPDDVVSVSPDLPMYLVTEASALLEKSELLLESLDGEALESLADAVSEVEMALETGNQSALRETLDALTERLFDLDA